MRRPTRALAALSGLAMAATTLVALPPTAADAAATCYGQAVTATTTNSSGAIIGTAGRDIIRGTAGDDVIFAGRGNDIVCGAGGNDKIFGQAGWDILIGNDGNDILHGGFGNDRAFGGNGDDKLYGNNQNDTLSGQNGNDLIIGGNGNDSLFGGNGDDRAFGSAGDDAVAGNAGKDYCRGDIGNDTATTCETDLSSENPFPIMLIGDGTTGGASGQDSYRPELMNKLVAANCNVNMVGRSSGHSLGNGAPAINYNVDQSHEARLGSNIAPATGQVRAAFTGYTKFNSPKLIVIQLGANDMFQWKDPNATRANIEFMIDELKAEFPGAKVVVSNIFNLDLPRISADPNNSTPADRDDDGEADMADYNDKIRTLALAKADAFVDIHTGLVAPGFSVDGIVPNSAGEAVIATRMFNNMKPLIPGC